MLFRPIRGGGLHIETALPHLKENISDPRGLSWSRSNHGRIRKPFHFQSNTIQYPYRPPERLRLDVGVCLGRQPDVRVSRQLLYCERIGPAVEQK